MQSHVFSKNKQKNKIQQKNSQSLHRNADFSLLQPEEAGSGTVFVEW